MSDTNGTRWWMAVLAAAATAWLGQSGSSNGTLSAADLRVGGLRVYRVPAALGASVASPDGTRLFAAVDGQPELLVIGVDGGGILGRVRLGEPAEHLAVHRGQLLVAGRSELRSFRLADLAKPDLARVGAEGAVVRLPVTEILAVLAPAEPVESTESSPDPFRATVAVVGRLGSRASSAADVAVVRVDPATNKTVGPALRLSAAADRDTASSWSLSGSGRRLYRSSRAAPTAFALDEGGRALPPAFGEAVSDCGAIAADPRSRFAFASDGAVLSGDDLRPLGRLAGAMTVAHPDQPVLFAFGELSGAPTASLGPTARISTVRVYRRPELTPLGQWTAPGVLTGRRPMALPDGRLLLTATALQVTDPAAAALLDSSGPSRPLAAGGSKLGGLDTLAALGGSLLRGSLLELAIDRARPALLGPSAEPAPAPAPASSGSSSSSRSAASESYILLVRVKFEDRLGDARPQLAAAPSGAARAGSVWTGSLARECFRELPTPPRVGVPTPPPPMVEFVKLAGPDGLTVEAATGRMSLPTTGLPPGAIPVEVGLRLGGEIVDRLAFAVRVRLPELRLRWPSGTGGTGGAGSDGEAESARPPALSAVAPDGRTLLLVEAGRRRLGAFVLPATDAESAEPSTELSAAAVLGTDQPIADIAVVGDLIALAVDGQSTLLLADRASLVIRHRVPLGELAPRYLAPAPPGPDGTPRLLVGGVDGTARTPKTVCVSLPDGKAVGVAIPTAGPMTVLPDAATVVIAGSPQYGTQFYSLADGRLREVAAPGTTASRWHPPSSTGWSDRLDRASRLGGWDRHPQLPVALIWGEPAELAGAVPAVLNAAPTFRTVSITGRRSSLSREVAGPSAPLPVAVVSAVDGRVLLRSALPSDEPISALRFASDGREVLIIGSDAVRRLALADLRGKPSVGAASAAAGIIATTPTAELEIGRGWRYRPLLLEPSDADARVSVIAGPTGMRANDAGTLVEWTPSGRDLGSHTVRLSVAGPTGPSVEQSFTLTVQPRSLLVPPPDSDSGTTIVPRVIGGAYADQATRVWLASPDGSILLRRDRQSVLVLPTDGTAVSRLDLGEAVGSVALLPGREPTALVALPDSRRVVLLDLATGRVLNRAELESGRPTKVLTLGPERLAVTDRGEIRRVEPEFFTDAGLVAHGVMAAASPDGSRLYTVARSEQLPERLREDLAEALTEPAERRMPDSAAGRGAIVSAAAAPRAAPWYLLVYRRTDAAVLLWDAVPLPARPDELVVAGDGRCLVLLLDGTLTVRSADDPSEVLRTLSRATEGDRFAEVHAHSASGGAWTVTRDGRLFGLWLDAVGAVQLQALELPVPTSSDPLADRWLGPARLAVPVAADAVWWIKAGRAYAVPVSALPPVEAEPLAILSEPPLLFKTGEPFRYSVRTNRASDQVKIQLRRGPSGAVFALENATLCWLPDRASRGDLHRVVIAVKDRSGQLASQAFLIRRERR